MLGRTAFNASAARNIGARHVDAPWICFVNTDIVLAPESATALAPVLRPGGLYRLWSTDARLVGTFACSRADFERVGGYDEVYACWGEEDNDLYDAFEFVGLESRQLPAPLPRHLAHADADRTRHYPVVDKMLGHAINRVYRLMKWDTARLRRELLTFEMRRNLYDKVAEVVTASLRSGQPGDLGAHQPIGLVPGGWSLSRIMTYRLTRDP